jgi:hypothetical protein
VVKRGFALVRRAGRIDAFVDGAADMLSYDVVLILNLRR